MKARPAFSLLELCLSLALFCLLLLGASQGYYSLLLGQKNLAREQELTAILRFAKTQSLVLGETLVLKPKDPEGNWSLGLILETEREQRPIQIWSWPASVCQIQWFGFESKQLLRFSSDPDQSATNGYFLFSCAGKSKKLILNRLAQLRLE